MGETTDVLPHRSRRFEGRSLAPLRQTNSKPLPGGFNDKHRSPVYPAVAQGVEGFVCSFEGERHDLGTDGDFGGERKELVPVLTRQVGHRAHRALTPEDLIGERRDIAHVDARADNGPAPGNGPEGRGYEGSDGGEDDRRVELLGWRFFGASRPLGAKASGELLRPRVVRAGEGEDTPSLLNSDLGHDVG